MCKNLQLEVQVLLTKLEDAERKIDSFGEGNTLAYREKLEKQGRENDVLKEKIRRLEAENSELRVSAA